MTLKTKLLKRILLYIETNEHTIKWDNEYKNCTCGDLEFNDIDCRDKLYVCYEGEHLDVFEELSRKTILKALDYIYEDEYSAEYHTTLKAYKKLGELLNIGEGDS